MDNSSISSGSSDGETTNQAKEEELVTHLQLRLTASHLPKVRLKKLLRKSPDTFATVASIVRKNGATNNQTVSPYAKTRYGEKQFLSSSFAFDTGNSEEDKMVEWGSTEVIHNSRSPQWIETIPLKYEYGSELFFYVRILQAESSRKSLTPTSQESSPMSKSSDDSSVASESFYGTPNKNRMGFCFGTALFEVGDILGSRNYTKVKRLKSGGCVYARVEPMQRRDEDKLRFKFQFQALNLVTTDKLVRNRLGLASEPSTVLEISRPHDSPTLHSWVTVFRSRPVFNSRNPCWDLAEVDLESCCRNADMSKTVRLSIYRIRSRNKQQKLIGMCETTMHNILANARNGEEDREKPGASSERDFFLQRNYQQLQQVGNLRVKVACLMTLSGRSVAGPLSPSSQNGCMSPPTTPTSRMPIARTPSTDTTMTGEEDPFNVDLRQLSVMRLSASVTESATNLSDFIDNGGQLDFCVAVDFTSSNGNPLEPGTLHFQSDDALNDYEEAITSIGNAIDKYNTSSDYCVWGFGAKFGDGIVRHMFQCGQDPTVKGVNGILDAYRGMFRSDGITMSGPTVFVKAIQAAAVRAHKSKTNNVGQSLQYTVLLIVTDGIMDNFEETREKLSVYAEVPLSVIIVGVGRADFQSMYSLCESPRTQQSTSRKNTTFVEFRQHQHDPRSLAQAALNDLPKQLSDYMIQNGLSMH